MNKLIYCIKFILISLIFASFSSIHSQNVPELLYFKFEKGIENKIFNFSSSGISYNAELSGQILGTGGQFNNCLIGTGGNGYNNCINSGLGMNTGTGSWTISLWMNDIAETTPGSAVYLFGDSSAGQFRCIYGGAAQENNLMLRGPFADVLVTDVMPGPTVVHFVYDGKNIIVYKNGVLFKSYSRNGINLTGTGPFKIGGYARITGNNSINLGGKIDEFRFYNRALDASEIAATWNIELGVTPNIPAKYSLHQNYPNPFNPTTSIRYDLKMKTNVKLVLYDVRGSEVSILVNNVQDAGSYVYEFNGENYSSGAYFYKLSAGYFTETKKMILIK
jgi:hypothetical protein